MGQRIRQGGRDLTEFVHLDSSVAIRNHFKDDEMLRVKQEINVKYRTNPITNREHLLSALALRGDEDVLDVGCGNAFLLSLVAQHVPHGSVLGVDVAPGILAAARRRFEDMGLRGEFRLMDADNLSALPRNAYDRVIANYMIHYVNNMEDVLNEFYHLVRPDGVVMLATESVHSMPEMFMIHYDSMEALNFPAETFRATPKVRFSLENGKSLLEKHFQTVTVSYYRDALEFSEPAPFIEFYTVGHRYCALASRPDPRVSASMYDALKAEVERRVVEKIESEGHFIVSKTTGAFLCRK